MVRSSIKAHTTAIIEGIISQAKSLGSITHPTVKGDLRELLIADLFSRYLVQDFGIGTGQIINQKEELSHQIDIVIYDKRILPPFIQSREIGLFPAEAVVAIIEVKSHLSKDEIRNTSKQNEILLKEIYNRESSYYKDLHQFQPLTSIIGFYDALNFQYDNNSENREQISTWMNSNANYIWSVCLLGEFSWTRIMNKEGVVNLRKEYLENSKAYLAILLDNLRSNAQQRYLRIIQRPHIDWFSLYIRDQNLQKLFARVE